MTTKNYDKKSNFLYSKISRNYKNRDTVVWQNDDDIVSTSGVNLMAYSSTRIKPRRCFTQTFLMLVHFNQRNIRSTLIWRLPVSISLTLKWENLTAVCRKTVITVCKTVHFSSTMHIVMFDFHTFIQNIFSPLILFNSKWTKASARKENVLRYLKQYIVTKEIAWKCTTTTYLHIQCI